MVADTYHKRDQCWQDATKGLPTSWLKVDYYFRDIAFGNDSGAIYNALTVILASLSEVRVQNIRPPRLAMPMAATNDAANAPVTTDGMYTLRT